MYLNNEIITNTNYLPEDDLWIYGHYEVAGNEIWETFPIPGFYFRIYQKVIIKIVEDPLVNNDVLSNIILKKFFSEPDEKKQYYVGELIKIARNIEYNLANGYVMPKFENRSDEYPNGYYSVNNGIFATDGKIEIIDRFRDTNHYNYNYIINVKNATWVSNEPILEYSRKKLKPIIKLHTNITTSEKIKKILKMREKSNNHDEYEYIPLNKESHISTILNYINSTITIHKNNKRTKKEIEKYRSLVTYEIFEELKKFKRTNNNCNFISIELLSSLMNFNDKFPNLKLDVNNILGLEKSPCKIKQLTKYSTNQ